MLSVLFCRLQLNSAAVLSSHGRSLFTNASPNLFRATPCLMAEPLKKKKKIDPAIIRAREDRKKKKIEKQIKRLEKNSQQLKPIDELEVPPTVFDTLQQRVRRGVATSHEEMESRALILKDWARFKKVERMRDVRFLDLALMSQQKALQELKLESEELYQAAIQTDDNLVPFNIKGPVHTPPIKTYQAPDGEYVDVSKNWLDPLKFE